TSAATAHSFSPSFFTTHAEEIGSTSRRYMGLVKTYKKSFDKLRTTHLFLRKHATVTQSEITQMSGECNKLYPLVKGSPPLFTLPCVYPRMVPGREDLWHPVLLPLPGQNFGTGIYLGT